MRIYGAEVEIRYACTLCSKFVLTHGYSVTKDTLKALKLFVFFFSFWLPGLCGRHAEAPHTYMRNQHISISFSL